MKDAPEVLVLARFGGKEAAHRVSDALSRQTWRRSRLVFMAKEAGEAPADSASVCAPDALPALLASREVDYFLFWPDDGDLQPAAIEKLVLALHLAPDQGGVTDRDAALWLLRRHPDLPAIATRWLDSASGFQVEIAPGGPPCFRLPEALTAGSTRPIPGDGTVPALPCRFENFEPVSEEPLWALPETEPDPRSVLFLVTSLPMGGACKFILDVVTQLAARGYRVAVATTSYDTNDPHPWLGELLRITPDVFLLSQVRPAELPRLAVHLARTRRCGRVVLSHTMTGYLLLPWLRRRLPGVSFVDYTHIEYETEWPAGGYALRSVNHRSLLDLSLVSSAHLRGWMSECGADAGRIRVCHTNIDAEQWRPDAAIRSAERGALDIGEETTVILYPCRIAGQKRPELMCQIVANLARATKAPFVVVVAGSGPYLPALKKFVEKNGLADRFRILGAVPLDRISRLHDAADIFLLPSLIEGIALALFEAMALESVPVVSDVGGQRELVTPDCGRLVPLGEPAGEIAAYVAALKSLVENPAQRRRMAAAGRERVRTKFPLSDMTDRFIAALDEADVLREREPVRLPEAAHTRDLAALAMDHQRLLQQGGLARDHAHDLRELLTRRDKTIAKLQRQLDEARAEIHNAEAYAAA